MEASDPSILALLGPVGSPLPRPSVLRVQTVRGLPLPLEVHPADPARSNLLLLDARGYVSLYGRVAAESAVEWTMLGGLQREAGWDQGRFMESNFMHAVNGKVYCNVGSLSFPLGSTVRWYTAVVGTEVDIHSIHFHGQTLLLHGHRTDSIQLLPRQVVTADMYAHSPGTWLLHCHVVDHIHAGMVMLYTVQAAGSTTAVRLPLPGGPATTGTATLPQTEERVPSLIASSLSGRLREYWVAAEVVQWPYVGAHIIDHHGTPGPPCNGVPYHVLATAMNGSFTWTKVVYRGYTDGTYSTRLPRSAEWEHLGILGPVLRAEVGDIMKVHFKNHGGQPFSVHPHGVAYPKSGEGAPYQDGTWSNPADTGDDIVLPGASWTYTWWVPESAGPGPADPSSVPWLYHGHVHEVKDENTGMIGVILVTARGAARVPGGVGDELRPGDVDRELVVLSKVFDEGRASGAPIVHIHRRGRELSAHGSGQQYDKFYTVNGKAGCSLSGMNATSGQRVRWYMTSLGNEIDLHHMSVTGHTMTQWGRRVTGVAMSPGTMFAVDMVAGEPGDWLLTSNVRAHIAQGLVSTFRVSPPPLSGAAAAPASLPLAGAQTRTYYLAAENVTWDYTPAGEDLCAPASVRAGVESSSFAPLDAGVVDAWGVGGRYDRAGTDLAAFPTDGRIFVGQGLENGTTIGRFYHKAVYVGYSDDTFSTVTYRPGHRPVNASLRGTGPADASTGILGPTLRAAVGDSLVVVFHNRMLTTVNFNIPHGPVLVAVSVRAPGNMTWRPVPPGTAGATVSSAAHYALPPGWTARYTYSVPPSAGPGPLDASTVAWEYKSTARLSHLHAGLVGGVLVAASPAALLPAAGSHGAAREYILAWFISNENDSPYLERNIQDRVANRAGLSTTALDAFVESNLKHAINGRLFCNLEGLTARVGETVRLHLLGLGSQLDMHTPHAHGQLLRVSKGRDGTTGATLTQYTTAAVGLHPGVMQTVDFTAAGAGSWLLECGVNDHWQAGMRASLLVTE